jgi:16S rRNA (uracil1498-N3)-methyltransferase
VAKWRAAALAAARQSRRPYVPPVAELHDTAAVETLIHDAVVRGALVVALHESAIVPFGKLLLAAAEEVVLIVGPEGGIDDAELERFGKAGAATALLGPTVLRTSTAAAVALGAIGVLTPRWG